jgi:hypothetical protein
MLKRWIFITILWIAHSSSETCRLAGTSRRACGDRPADVEEIGYTQHYDEQVNPRYVKDEAYDEEYHEEWE